MSVSEIEDAFPWSAPREKQTKRGLRIFRRARPTDESVAFFKENYDALRAIGVAYKPDFKDPNKWEFTWWQMPSKVLIDEKERVGMEIHVAGARIQCEHDGLGPDKCGMRGAQFCPDRGQWLCGNHAIRNGCLDGPVTVHPAKLFPTRGSPPPDIPGEWLDPVKSLTPAPPVRKVAEPKKKKHPWQK